MSAIAKFLVYLLGSLGRGAADDNWSLDKTASRQRHAVSDGNVAFEAGRGCSASLPPTTEEVNAIARPRCLSVCLLARLLKNVCMDFDDILRADRCRDMDELVNF